MKVYSLRKCRHILRHHYHLFRRKKKRLSQETCTSIQKSLLALQDAILKKDRESAHTQAKQVQLLALSHLKKSLWDQLRDLVCALGFALIVAVAVRQMWFEFYEIPSGSMRPTFKEQDRLAVSKTAFGVNIPLTPQEFYFDPDLVKRNGIVIFTGEDMDIRDVDTLYFYLFPGKKQYVKRLIGKPGDILYFYGGKIYGIDKEGKDISLELQLKELASIDHIPFIDFERKITMPPYPTRGVFSPIFLYQMNEPVAKLSVNAQQKITGEMLSLKGIHDSDAPAVASYGDLWGFHNFATARLLNKNELPTSVTSDAPLYLELKHSPSLSDGKLVYDEMGRARPVIGLSTSFIPLSQEHLKALLSHLYTARFVVKGGKAYRFGLSEKQALTSSYTPKLPGIPDGCYEFISGKAYEVLWQGITKELPSTHPLYSLEANQLGLLFNVGMEWDMRFSPQEKRYHLTPARYAYFREGDLYVMGGSILSQNDPTMQDFVQNEQKTSHPFIDRGPPLDTEGNLNKALIEQNGILIPEEMYLVLGDNHAMSADSREFGFVPASNLRGAPDFIFWPPGKRWGLPLQPLYPLFNLPRTIVWALAAICIGGGTLYWRRKNKLPRELQN